jgi:hypothetical protein
MLTQKTEILYEEVFDTYNPILWMSGNVAG